MAKRFSNLLAKMPKRARERARARTQTMAAELTLAELCKAFDVSQEALAKIVGVKQTKVSKVELREDMRLSTLVTRFPNRGEGWASAGVASDREQKERTSHLRFSFSCNSRHRIFPVTVLGSSATNSTTRGTLNAAMRPRAHSMMSSARRRPSAPGLGTISAFTVSPR